ncbi:MAG: RNA polymerase sigma factor, partial [Balneolales bacterium]|nr:RNA polymerase sigma factor [Balneolales bacterium]
AYSKKVYNPAISYTKNEEDAEEILQDVFITIYNSADKFKFTAAVSTWIYRITVNKCIDFTRKKSNRFRKGLLSIYRPNSNELNHDIADFVHPGVHMENQENAKLLFRAIEELPEKQKTAFILTQVEGLSQQQVAEIMEITRKAVESLVQRAKANLRKTLEKFFPERGNTTNKTSN